MKIMACCGQGLGSSFMVEMNIKKVLKKLELDNISVSHGSATEAFPGDADLFVVGQDLYDAMAGKGDIITLTNIVSMPELEEKLKEYFTTKGVI
ncbi:MAG: PTS sugar transporter subunit IIB [Erysipelothrix sp.]|nr:PTS sugar transporter subunit IIB [Erysipelothrix sp.]